MSKYAKQIADLQATRKAKAAEMTELADKASEQGRTFDTGEQELFDTLKSEVVSIDKNISNLRDLEAMEKADEADAATAKAVSDEDKRKSTVSVQRNHAEAKDTTKLEPGIAFARMARVKALAFTGQAGTRDEVQIAKHVYPRDEKLVAALQQRAAVPAANTQDDNWAGNLVIEGGGPFADFVEFLRERGLFGQISGQFRSLPFDAPVLVQGSGGTAQWVQEGHAKPLTQWSYTRVRMNPLKVAAIAAATQEMLQRASAAADTLIRDELARAVNARIDSTLISSAAAVPDESPAGLLNGTSALELTGDGSVQGIRCDIAEFLKALVGDNLSVAGSFWVMPETVAIDLSMATKDRKSVV